MNLEVIGIFGSMLWFTLWWSRFVVQRHDVELKGTFYNKITVLAKINTHEVVSAKKGVTGRKIYNLNINNIDKKKNNDITGKYLVELTPEAEEKSMTAHLSLGILYWFIFCGIDYFLHNIYNVYLPTIIIYHLIMSILFSWVVYKQIFYDKPKSKSIFHYLIRRPNIRSLPIASILLIWLSIDMCRLISFPKFTIWVEDLHASPTVESFLLRVPIWSFGALGSFYLKLRKMYHNHCEIVGIVEDPQIMYWIIAVPIATAWLVMTIWAA